MKSWTADDIEAMKNGFLKGLSIKVIAKELGRSPTALNKALSRFCIRKPRPPIKRTLWNDFGNRKPEKTLTPMEAIKKLDRRLRRAQKLKEKNVWVVMDDVLSLLDKHHHTVYLKTKKINPSDSEYVCDGKNVTALSLIFLANRYRIESDKAPFYVEGVTL